MIFNKNIINEGFKLAKGEKYSILNLTDLLNLKLQPYDLLQLIILNYVKWSDGKYMFMPNKVIRSKLANCAEMTILVRQCLNDLNLENYMVLTRPTLKYEYDMLVGHMYPIFKDNDPKSNMWYVFVYLTPGIGKIHGPYESLKQAMYVSAMAFMFLHTNANFKSYNEVPDNIKKMVRGYSYATKFTDAESKKIDELAKTKDIIYSSNKDFLHQFKTVSKFDTFIMNTLKFNEPDEEHKPETLIFDETAVYDFYHSPEIFNERIRFELDTNELKGKYSENDIKLCFSVFDAFAKK